MKTKILAEGQYIVSSILKDNACPVEDSPLSTDANYRRYHAGLLDVLKRVAIGGLQQFPSSLSHAIHKDPKIFEFIRGKLRLIYFHGSENTIVVCTEIVIKKTQKADPKIIAKAIEAHNSYKRALVQGKLIVIGEDDED